MRQRRSVVSLADELTRGARPIGRATAAAARLYDDHSQEASRIVTVPGQKPRAEPWLMGSVESENPAETLAFARAVRSMLHLRARGF
jgi:hypothetical protein